MIELPSQLTQRLTLPDATTLRRALGVVGELLPKIYKEAVDHQRPRDNANIFGLRVSAHLWAALKEPAHTSRLGGATVRERNHASALVVGERTIAIHKIGRTDKDDIHSSFPESSDTQRGYGERNQRQMSLFDSEPEAPLPDDRAYALTELVVGHFGNPETGFAKWYVGAWIYEDGIPRWAWQRRQPVASLDHGVASPQVGEVTAYDQRRPADFSIGPRKASETQTSSDDAPTA